MRTITRTALLALLPVLALAAATATAQAATTEGPFYKIAGSRLASGSSKELKAKTRVDATFYMGSTIVTCESAGIKAGGTINGSSGANSGSSSGAFEFSKCSVVQGGDGCRIKGSAFTTPTLTGKLVYFSSTRTGILGVDFTSATKKYGTIELEGTSCLTNTITLSGKGILAELVNGEGKAIEVGKEPAEAKEVGIQFTESGTEKGKVYTEEEGKLVTETPVLESNLGGGELRGTLGLELASGASWGVFA